MEKLELGKAVVDELNKLPVFAIELGVFAPKEDEKKKSKRVGVTNAELMYIQENGSPAQHIPPRPILNMSIEYAEKNLLDKAYDKALKNFIENDFDKSKFEEEFAKLGVNMEKYARKVIYANDGTLTPNAPSTAYAKWKKEKHKKSDTWTYPEGNHPLFDTGELARSISSRLINL